MIAGVVVLAFALVDRCNYSMSPTSWITSRRQAQVKQRRERGYASESIVFCRISLVMLSIPGALPLGSFIMFL